MTTATARTNPATFTCGYCNTGTHDFCPGKIRGATKSTPDGMWTCPCTDPSHDNRQPHCLECKHAGEGEVGPMSWSCLDKSACLARRQARMDTNPVIQKIRELKEKRMSQTEAEKPTRKPAAPKVGNCLHCGEVTKGGKFLPGHDAAFVSDQVGLVLADRKNEKRARAAMAETSEALQKKFERSLELGLEKIAKQEAAKVAKAEAAAAAKEAKVEERKAKAAAKEAAEAEVPVEA